MSSVIRKFILDDNLESFQKKFFKDETAIYEQRLGEHNVFSYAILIKAKKITQFLCAHLNYSLMNFDTTSNPLIIAAFVNNYSLMKKIQEKIDRKYFNNYSEKNGRNALSTYFYYNIDKKKNYKNNEALYFFANKGFQFDLPMESKLLNQKQIDSPPLIWQILTHNPTIINHTDFISALLDNGLNPNLSYKGTSILQHIIYCAEKDQSISPEIFIDFIEKGANIDFCNYKNQNITEMINEICLNGQQIVEQIENYLFKKTITADNYILTKKIRI